LVLCDSIELPRSFGDVGNVTSAQRELECYYCRTQPLVRTPIQAITTAEKILNELLPSQEAALTDHLAGDMQL
jgi:hypothetical protein